MLLFLVTVAAIVAVVVVVDVVVVVVVVFRSSASPAPPPPSSPVGWALKSSYLSVFFSVVFEFCSSFFPSSSPSWCLSRTGD